MTGPRRKGCSRPLFKNTLIGTAAALCAVAVGPARADHAVVVGVCHYPALPDAEELDGPDNDAQAVADKLTQAGFTKAFRVARRRTPLHLCTGRDAPERFGWIRPAIERIRLPFRA